MQKLKRMLKQLRPTQLAVCALVWTLCTVTAMLADNYFEQVFGR